MKHMNWLIIDSFTFEELQNQKGIMIIPKIKVTIHVERGKQVEN